MELRGYHLHQVIKEIFWKLMDFVGFRSTCLESDLVKKAHKTLLGSPKALSS